MCLKPTRNFASFVLQIISRLSLLLIVDASLTGRAHAFEQSYSKEYYVFLSNQFVATVTENWNVPTKAFSRENALANLPSEKSILTGTLTQQGFVKDAEYKRMGQHGERHVRVFQEKDGALILEDILTGKRKQLSGRPIVFLETLHFLKLQHGLVDVEILDIVTAESLSGRLVFAAGKAVVSTHEGVLLAKAGPGNIVRHGPGAFTERRDRSPPSKVSFSIAPRAQLKSPKWGDTLLMQGFNLPPKVLSAQGAGQRILQTDGPPMKLIWEKGHADRHKPSTQDRMPAVFIESDDASVQEYANAHGGDDVWQDALQLAKAIHGDINTKKGGGPPSARSTLLRKAGDCDDVTALLVAVLRARGHAARPVVGYDRSTERYVPHAWAEVWNGEEWMPVDALRPGIGPFATHLKLFDGLGSPLTMGRVIGTWEPVEGRTPD